MNEAYIARLAADAAAAAAAAAAAHIATREATAAYAASDHVSDISRVREASDAEYVSRVRSRVRAAARARASDAAAARARALASYASAAYEAAVRPANDAPPSFAAAVSRDAAATSSTPADTPLMGVRRLMQTYTPDLYNKVLGDTLGDILEEYSLAAGPLKARLVLLRGFGSLAAAAICQIGVSLVSRIKGNS